MNWDRLVRVTAPEGSPLDWDAASAHLKVDDEEQKDDVLGAVDDALALIEGPRGCGICLLTQTWRLSLDCFPSTIVIPMGPVQSVASVKYVDQSGDEQTLDPALYLLDKEQDPAVVVPAYGKTWPTPRAQPGAVRITFVAGFGDEATDVPPDLMRALKVILRSLYDGDGSIPPAAQAILNRYGVFGAF